VNWDASSVPAQTVSLHGWAYGETGVAANKLPRVDVALT
jgi:hypothetical protein